MPALFFLITYSITKCAISLSVLLFLSITNFMYENLNYSILTIDALYSLLISKRESSSISF
jgi:hypothetical protein